MRRFLVNFLFAGLLLSACAPAGAPRPTPAELVPARQWRFQAAEHVALWYHGLAHTGTPASDAARALPLYDDGYVPRAVRTRRALALETTPLEERAGEFATAFRRADSFRQLEVLPLFFADRASLDAAVRVWNQVGGDPRRAGSPDAANAVALLSGLFPQPRQREVLASWTQLLAEEQRGFHDRLWREARPQLDSLANRAAADWAGLAAALQPLLAYLGTPGGDVFLVPALEDEGRLLLRGGGQPRVAVGVALPRAAAEDNGDNGLDVQEEARLIVYRFLRELVTPLAGEAAREYVAPAALRGIGRDIVEQRAAVHAAALALDAVSASHGMAYRRAYLGRAGVASPDGGPSALERAFRQAYPLPPELERGLAETMRDALAGI